MKSITNVRLTQNPGGINKKTGQQTCPSAIKFHIERKKRNQMSKV